MYFDEAKAQRTIKFIENLKHTKDPWYGVNFELLPWQREIVSDVFGTMNEDGYRQYNTAYVEIPKKNGKSEMAAAVALYMLGADGERGAEVYGAAADRQQASIVFDVAMEMVEQSPALKKRIKPTTSQKRMIYKPTNSFYQVLSSEAFTKHGLNVHGVIFDELHAQPNRELYDVLTKGSGDARMQPLFFLITTAGDDPDRTSIGWEVHQKALDVLQGHRKLTNFYPKIYGLGEDEDWTDEENWKKANPSIGHTIRIDTVRNWYEDAKESPAEEKAFRQLRLNQWVKIKTSKWLSLDIWDASTGAVIPDKLKGRECYGGLDLSSKIDLTSFVLIFTPTEEDPNYYVLPKFWIPEENIKERVQRDHVPYDSWVQQGLIQTTPGNVIDYDFIKKEIMDAADMYDLQEVGYDKWHAEQIAIQLEEQDINMVPVIQGAKSMSEPMKNIEVLTRKQRLKHGGHKVLRWNLSNVETKMDENENVRPVKGKSIERIDGFVAMVNSMARIIVYEDDSSVYENKGIKAF
ncbi:terminase large subunit [Salibacterium lacus]|uniref:Terminase large subunit n=1 Tax=Salibacterium lacus TaxID=1898109 RepID=A0ABW5SZL6_9BACI